MSFILSHILSNEFHFHCYCVFSGTIKVGYYKMNVPACCVNLTFSPEVSESLGHDPVTQTGTVSGLYSKYPLN